MSKSAEFYDRDLSNAPHALDQCPNGPGCSTCGPLRPDWWSGELLKNDNDRKLLSVYMHDINNALDLK